MYDQVLVATDGSDRITKAITEALGLAGLTDAALHPSTSSIRETIAHSQSRNGSRSKTS